MLAAKPQRISPLKLKISAVTVSRALNDSYEITKRPKKKVISMAEKLNYHPNQFAKVFVKIK